MKKIITGFILGALIMGTIVVMAANTISSSIVTYNNKTVEKSLDELYDEAVTGKELIATAITNKGVTTSNTATYQTMADNISNIDTDHSAINQKIMNLESKHNTDISAISSSVTNISQELNNLDKNIYSQTETKIGTWIDGRTIYRKVVFLTSAMSISYTEWSISKIPVSDIDIILNTYCIATDNLSFHYLSSNINNTTISFMATRNFSVNTNKIILEYVKK